MGPPLGWGWEAEPGVGGGTPCGPSAGWQRHSIMPARFPQSIRAGPRLSLHGKWPHQHVRWSAIKVPILIEGRVPAAGEHLPGGRCAPCAAPPRACAPWIRLRTCDRRRADCALCTGAADCRPLPGPRAPRSRCDRTAMERPLVKAPFRCGAGFWVLLAEELETADEAGRFDDESLCYSRVAPVSRCLAAWPCSVAGCRRL